MRIPVRSVVRTSMILALLAGCAAPARMSRLPLEGSPAPSASASNAGQDGIAYDVGAAAANLFYVPGKAILCTFGGAAGLGILAVTVGSGYGGAAGFVREGCGGKWLVTGDDLRREAGKGFRP